MPLVSNGPRARSQTELCINTTCSACNPDMLNEEPGDWENVFVNAKMGFRKKKKKKKKVTKTKRKSTTLITLLRISGG